MTGMTATEGLMIGIVDMITVRGKTIGTAATITLLVDPRLSSKVTSTTSRSCVTVGITTTTTVREMLCLRMGTAVGLQLGANLDMLRRSILITTLDSRRVIIIPEVTPPTSTRTITAETGSNQLLILTTAEVNSQLTTLMTGTKRRMTPGIITKISSKVTREVVGTETTTALLIVSAGRTATKAVPAVTNRTSTRTG